MWKLFFHYIGSDPDQKPFFLLNGLREIFKIITLLWKNKSNISKAYKHKWKLENWIFEVPFLCMCMVDSRISIEICFGFLVILLTYVILRYFMNIIYEMIAHVFSNKRSLLCKYCFPHFHTKCFYQNDVIIMPLSVAAAEKSTILHSTYPQSNKKFVWTFSIKSKLYLYVLFGSYIYFFPSLAKLNLRFIFIFHLSLFLQWMNGWINRWISRHTFSLI